MKSVSTAHNKNYPKTSTQYHHATAESRTSAHGIENAEPEIFYTNACL